MTQRVTDDDRKTKVQLMDEVRRLRRDIESLVRSESSSPIGSTADSHSANDNRNHPVDDGVHQIQTRYRDFVESVEDGCFEVDLQGIFTFVNKAMSRIHGYAQEELIGKDHREYASPEEARAIYRVFNTIYKTGQPARIIDYTIQHKDGTKRNLEVSASLIKDGQGHPIGFRGITRDRTGKKSKELELARYRDFVENVEDACFEVNLRGDITFFNDAACRIFGYPPERFMGMNNREYTTAETAREIYRIFNRVYRTGEPAEVQDYEIIQDSGQLRYLQMVASLIRNPTGDPIGFRGICTDVTERKQMERETERLNSLLSQAQRLEAIGTLAGGVAHNFNNLFMSIQGYVSLMLIDIPNDHPNHQRLKTIESHLKRGAELTAKLLGYASSAYQTKQDICINDVMDAAVARFSGSQRKAVFEKAYGEDVRKVSADMEQLTHVFINLFINAEQAMDAGGTIYLSTENVVLDSEFVQPYHRKPGAYVKALVKDTGQGMNKETLDRIFEPFFTTRDFSRGAGLGLASAYGVIQSHGGIIVAASEEGKGASLSIYLPSVKQTTKPVAAPVAASAKAGKTILLVDDEQVVVDVVGEMIAAFGYNVLTAGSAQSAVELFRENKGAIDLVIMDMVMPGVGGDQAINLIRAIDPDVKVILISGYMEAGESKKYAASKGRAFLKKPLEPKALQHTISQLLSSG